MGFAVSSSELQSWIDRGLVERPQPMSADPAPLDRATGDDASEKNFQADVEKFARKHGWKVYHTRMSKGSAFGFPDLVMIRGRSLIVAELKVGKNVPTDDQTEWLDAFQAAGVQVYLWRPTDWPSIVEVLRA